MSYCRDLSLPDASDLVRTRLLIVRQLTERLTRLNEEIAEVTKALQRRVHSTNTPLLELCGVGAVIAARLIGELGAAPRVHSAAALASLAGVSPVEVSSGGRHGHRLNRGGNRKLKRGYPHHRAEPAAVRPEGTGVLCEEAGRGQDGEGSDAVPEAPAGGCTLSLAKARGVKGRWEAIR